MAYLGGAQSWARRQNSPITIGLLATLVVTYLLVWFTEYRLFPFLALNVANPVPWTVVTYPFAGGVGIVGFLFMLLWLYWVGVSLESDLGPAKFAGLLLAMTLLPAIFLGLASVALGRPATLGDAWLLEAGLTVVWGTRNSAAPIRLYGIIPLTGAIIAILSVIITLFVWGPVLGWPAILHLGIAYLFATNRIPFFMYSRPVAQYRPSRQKVENDARYFDEVRKREQERDERERLRKLFEKSGLDE